MDKDNDDFLVVFSQPCCVLTTQKCLKYLKAFKLFEIWVVALQVGSVPEWHIPLHAAW